MREFIDNNFTHVLCGLILLIITVSVKTGMCSIDSIAYVASDDNAVLDMLGIANAGPEDIVYDLGSGDGRIPIAAVSRFNAKRGVGIEIDPKLIKQSLENTKKTGLSDRVEFIQGDLFTKDFSQADVVTLFLGHNANIRLRPKIFSTLKPGTRIISHQFNMGEWAADKTLTIRRVYIGGMYGTWYNSYGNNSSVPDYSGNESNPATDDKIFMWKLPARVAGTWSGTIETAEGKSDYKLILNQQLSMITGELQFSGHSNQKGRTSVEVLGNKIRIGYHSSSMNLQFDGVADGDYINGTIEVLENAKNKQQIWKAKRDKTNLTGTWQWTSAAGSRKVKLRIIKNDGKLSAVYIDKEKEIPVTDFYDFGGGFYFTLMNGRQGDTTVINDDTGWLIGYAIIDQGKLKGNIKFYPYSGTFEAEELFSDELLEH